MEEVTPVATEPEAPKEAPKETPKEEPKTPEFISDKFAALARKEKAVVKSRQEISQAKAEMEKERQAMAQERAEFQRWKALKENAKMDPDAYLNEAGLSYGYLTERTLKGGTDPNAILEKANQRISEFERKQEEERKKAEEQQKTLAQKDFEERVANFVAGIHDFVGQNKETYELIDLHGQQNLVWDVIQEAARRGDSLTVKQAADKVENYLGQQVEKALSAKKFKDRFEAKKAPEAPKEPGAPTLNNNMNTTTPVNPGIISDQERMQRALAALNKAIGQ